MQKKMELNSDMRVYFDMDGTIAKWCDVPVEESRKPGYYADLEPETELLDFMRAAMKRGENIYILSSYYTDTRALLEKKKWLDQYLPEILLSLFHFFSAPILSIFSAPLSSIVCESSSFTRISLNVSERVNEICGQLLLISLILAV